MVKSDTKLGQKFAGTPIPRMKYKAACCVPEGSIFVPL